MVTYSINNTEPDFVQKKAFFDDKLATSRKNQQPCSYGILKQRDSYSNTTVYEHIYTFQS